MAFTVETPWKYETSEETGGSVFFSYVSGRLFFSNEDTSEKMIINYRGVGVGNGKGPPFGLSQSRKQDPSGGFSNVAVVPHHNFGPLSFPCRGYLIGVGATAGVVGSVLNMDITGGGVSIVLFGQVPVFAGIRIWGGGRALFPGAGFTGAFAHYWVEDV